MPPLSFSNSSPDGTRVNRRKRSRLQRSLETSTQMPGGTLNHKLDNIFRNYDGIPFRITFWNGTIWQSSVDAPLFGVELKTEEAWKTLVSKPDEAALGEQYVAGAIEITGDLYSALRAFPQIEECISSNLSSLALWLHSTMIACQDGVRRTLRLGSLHSERRDAAAISYHYDKPSRFYQLFLGPSMVYSCAYFQNWHDDLTKAQHAKLDLICRKLDLKPHDRYLDIGCGWGSLLLHAATAYGVNAHGVSLSNEQVRFADEAIRKANRAASCQVYLQDYRELRNVHVKFDKISSVGMCEHVGHKNIGAYFADVHHMLMDGGLFLNHGITSNMCAKKKRTSFIDRYVFPDGELLTLSELVHAAESAGFEVRDVEDLREHYEKTLHCWVSALREHKAEVIALTSEETFRIWELYMAGSAEAFRRGDIALHQMLLSKNAAGRSSATKNRREWYIPNQT